jgi:hypothetical protein
VLVIFLYNNHEESDAGYQSDGSINYSNEGGGSPDPVTGDGTADLVARDSDAPDLVAGDDGIGSGDNKRKREDDESDVEDAPCKKAKESNQDSDGPNRPSGPFGSGGFSGPNDSDGSQSSSNGSAGVTNNYSIIYIISSIAAGISQAIENLF